MARKIKFEDALKQLEQLTEEIERGEIGLEESIAKYEQGMNLVNTCREILVEAEMRIQKLSATPDGRLTATDAPELNEPELNETELNETERANPDDNADSDSDFPA